MDELPGVVVAGVSGRMGQMLLAEVEASPAVKLVGATDRAGHDWIGQDLGEALGGAAKGIVVSDDLLEPISKARILLDFTTPDASVAHAELTAQARAVHVIGTTGFDDAHLATFEAAARHATIIRAGNFSLGVNLLLDLVRQVSAALDDDYDIEVIESHHNQKVDAPSGTALMLGEAAAEGRGRALKDISDRGRDGITGARERGDIGFTAIRGGDIVGEHDVMFAAPGERLTIRHVASDRRLFARGALKAAIWGLGRPPGQYDMRDVLGLK